MDAIYRELTLIRYGGIFLPKPTGATTMAKAKRPATKKATNATKAGAIVKAAKTKGGGKAKGR
jgi:hypothetical protein